MVGINDVQVWAFTCFMIGLGILFLGTLSAYLGVAILYLFSPAHDSTRSPH